MGSGGTQKTSTFNEALLTQLLHSLALARRGVEKFNRPSPTLWKLINTTFPMGPWSQL
jgi:hypothetical protein